MIKLSNNNVFGGRFKMKSHKRKSIFIYILTIAFSSIFIFCMNSYITKDMDFFTTMEGTDSAKGIVLSIKNKSNYAETYYTDENVFDGTNIEFSCRILSGENKNEIVSAVQTISEFDVVQYKEVEEGDKILLYNTSADNGRQKWEFVQYIRTDQLFVLGAIFLFLLLLFGRKKGINTIISLLFTCLAIFMVFIPSVLVGFNIYFWSIITCIFIIIMTHLIVNGADKKSLAAMIGCTSGVFLSGAVTLIMDTSLKLTGLVNEEASYLIMINPNDPIDLKAVIFSAIIIGAVGAIMDVSMSIASSLFEIYQKSNVSTAKGLIKSGFSIGRDIMGTMANTLVLAYIGSSMSTVLLLVSYNSSFLELLNREMVIVEILQAIVGSLGILLAIPLTSVICGFLYTNSLFKSKKVN